jgi:hypothetical protein
MAATNAALMLSAEQTLWVVGRFTANLNKNADLNLPHSSGVNNEESARNIFEMCLADFLGLPACLRTGGAISAGD